MTCTDGKILARPPQTTELHGYAAGIVWTGQQGRRRYLGELSAAAIQRGRTRPVNDTWVAACCLAYQLPLATLNLKDFKDFAEHHGLRLLEP
jgi:predicted nucleic acid-binding protein